MISVIGAGPSGLYSSFLLAKQNLDVKIFDQKPKIGVPVQCTGIITSKIEDILRLKEDTVKNKITKIELNSDNNFLTLNLKEPDIVVDRQRFDQFLAEKAEKAGAKILMNRKFIQKKDANIEIRNLNTKTNEDINSEILIGADGPLSSIYNIVNPNLKRKFYKGLQIRAKGNFEKDKFKVYLGSVCPDFFAWLVPEDDETARIGLATFSNPKPLMKKFLEKINIKKATEIQSGLIPIYNPKIATKKDNIFLVGDAAGQIKSSTGGGIIQDLIAAECLADSIINNKDYEHEWKDKLKKDLDMHLKIRKILNSFKVKDYNRLIDLIKSEKILSLLENESRDRPSKFIMKMIRYEPRLLFFGAKFALKTIL
jgi:geranylgeranyl reductase family protein